MEKITINEENINSRDAYNLINELSDELEVITGNDGRSSFNKEDVTHGHSVFVIARDVNNYPLGCGALRYYSDGIGEIKRMYVRKKSSGIGSKLLKFLENKAREFNYNKLILETRVINKNAVKFYNKNGYSITQNYGRYIGRVDALCFEKTI